VKIAIFFGMDAAYAPKGNEGFIRVELADEEGHLAWPQPFWLLPG